MKKESFVLYTKINEVVRELSDEQKGRLFQAILDYEETGEPPELDQLLRLVFIPIKQDLDRNSEKWEAQTKARSEAGKKGMASRYGKKDPAAKADKAAETGTKAVCNSKTNAVNTDITDGNRTNAVNTDITDGNRQQQSTTNITDNVYDNVYVNEYVNENVNDNTNTPLSSPGTGGTGTGAQASSGTDGRFEAFWKIYPKKQGKGAALKAWKKIKPDKQLYETILASVQDNVNRNQQWKRDNGQYIPNPSTWLNQQRWLDEIPNQQIGGVANGTGNSGGSVRQRIGGADDYHDFRPSTGFRSADSIPDTDG